MNYITVVLVACVCMAFAEVDLESTKTSVVPVVDLHLQELKGVIVDKVHFLPLGVSWEPANRTIQVSESGTYLLSLQSENTNILEVVNSSVCIWDNDDLSTNVSFAVRGVFLGHTKVRISVFAGCDGVLPDAVWSGEVSASVLRAYSVLVDAVTLIMAILVSLNFINMGVQLDLALVGKSLRRPIGPAIGFACQFLFMPLAAYGLGYLLLEERSLRLGLFVLGCSPGGSMSNFWTLLFGGDLNLSITMTFISTVAALAMMPLWIFTLGAGLFHDKAATIPYLNLAGSLVLLTFPMGLGLLIQHKSPRMTQWSHRIVTPFTILTVVVGVGVGLYANSFIFSLFTWRVVLSGILVAWGGYTFGALVALLFRLDKSQVIAVSIETAFQNPAVAFVLLLLSLPQPDADLASAPVVAQLMLTGLPMWALLAVSKTHRWFKERGRTLKSQAELPQIDTLHRAYLAVDLDDQQLWEIGQNKVDIVKISGN